jgi:uncharacterized SAM-binding protein YcdF (DUF218 family)
MLVFFTNPLIINGVLLAWEPPYKSFSETPSREFGIVMTGVTNINKTSVDRTFFNKGADRITHALQLYRMGKIKKIIVTGGQGLNPSNSYSEAELLQRFLLMAGVPQEDIFIEEESKNTHENALLTKELLEKKGISTSQEFILITSAFHMKRAKGCFDAVGIKTFTFPVDYYSHDPKYDLPSLLYPRPEALFQWQIVLREIIGWVVYSAVGYI